MRCPVSGMLTCNDLAISGSKPIMVNSVVPMPKPPMASGNIRLSIIDLLFLEGVVKEAQISLKQPASAIEFIYTGFVDYAFTKY
ncbi:hypothetical protein D3C80_1796550 [compost metagenome]